MTTLNSYKITWAFLIPTKGIATKKDSNFNFQRGMFNSYMACFSPNKELALQKVKELEGTLGKEYSVLFITDKQFGMIQQDFKNRSHNLMDVATDNQKSEIFTII